MAETVTDPMELLRLLDLDPAQMPGILRTQPAFRCACRYFVGLMGRGDANDPCWQVLPLAAARRSGRGALHDPVGDQASSQANGILKKYRGRALMITTGACAVHCHIVSAGISRIPSNRLLRHWQAALDRLRDLPDTAELIPQWWRPLSLSIGASANDRPGRDDPAAATPAHPHPTAGGAARPRDIEGLEHLLSRSRFPDRGGDPTTRTRSPPGSAGTHRAEGRRAHLLNRSVLLKSVNDDADTLENLSESLFPGGVCRTTCISLIRSPVPRISMSAWHGQRCC